MAAQRAFGQRRFLMAERREARLHAHRSRQQAGHAVGAACGVDERLEQRHHAAALGEQRLAGGDMGGERVPEIAALRRVACA